MTHFERKLYMYFKKRVYLIYLHIKTIYIQVILINYFLTLQESDQIKYGVLLPYLELLNQSCPIFPTESVQKYTAF